MRISKREKEVLKRCIFSNKEIAKDLVIENSTIKTYLHNLYIKFKTKNRTELLIKALKLNIIKLDDINLNIDIGFWNKNGIYIENYKPVDLSKE